MRSYLSLLIIFLAFYKAVSQESFSYLQIDLYREGGLVSANLLVENERGQKTGADFFNQIYREIPGAEYGDQDCGDDLSPEEVTVVQIFSMENPLQGTYYVNVIGLGEDRYRLLFQIRRNVERLKFEYSDTIAEKEIKKYKLVYSSDPSIPITVEEVKELDPLSTIDEMIAFIDKAYAHKKIDPRGIATSLISKLEVAKKALEQEKSKESVNALNAFLNELEAQHEKHIAEEVYLYLKEKGEALIRQLGSSG